MKLSDQGLLAIYYQMQRIRYFEDTVSKLYRQGKVVGGVFTGQGQEAIPAGTCFPLHRTDQVSPVHRDMGVFLAKGMDAGVLMSQIMGKATGPSRGKDTWTHAGDLELGIIASTSMLGSTLPIACGVAWALRAAGRDDVVVSYFGEGATARGDFHEALNFAAIHRLPVVFVCENNLWAYSTPVYKEMPPGMGVAERSCAYGFPGVSVDGNDPLAVLQAATAALSRARRGEGASLIECKTYRYHGHSEHDEATYRPPQEVEEWHDRDPIHRFHDLLTERGALAEERATEIRTQIQQEIEKAVDFAENSPFPQGEEALEGVYHD